MRTKENQHSWLEELAPDTIQGYPVATIAFYGPDDKLATKAVVSIIAEDGEILAMKKWHASSGDIRAEVPKLQEFLAFILDPDVKSVVMPDRIIGCPHEEGVDYPTGEQCPACSFWADKDRWTGEKID